MFTVICDINQSQNAKRASSQKYTGLSAFFVMINWSSGLTQSDLSLNFTLIPGLTFLQDQNSKFFFEGITLGVVLDG